MEPFTPLAALDALQAAMHYHEKLGKGEYEEVSAEAVLDTAGKFLEFLKGGAK